MSSSEEKGGSLWRPAPGPLARIPSRGFIPVAPVPPVPARFVGETEDAQVNEAVLANIADAGHEDFALSSVSLAEQTSEDVGSESADCAGHLDEKDPVSSEMGHGSIDLDALRLEAHRQGFEEGQVLARAELSGVHGQALAVLKATTEAMRAHLDDPEQLYEPLKRLALHVAEILVRGELQVSGQAINRLIRHCIDALAEPHDRIVVRLNPEDAERLLAMGEAAIAGLQVEHDPQLAVGSVKLRSLDTAVEDLLDSRLEAMANLLLREPQAWLSKSPLLQPRPAELGLGGDIGRSRWAGRVVDTVDVEPVAAERDIGADYER